MQSYCIFLRGINVGGNNKVPMADLRTALEQAGFTNVQTVLASGNIIVDSTKNQSEILQSIADSVERHFACSPIVQLRTAAELQQLVASKPFAQLPNTKSIKTNVSLAAKTIICNWKNPYNLHDVCTIHAVQDKEVCFSINSDQGQTTYDAMSALEAEFGKTITTRTWNTILKLYEKLQ